MWQHVVGVKKNAAHAFAMHHPSAPSVPNIKSSTAAAGGDAEHCSYLLPHLAGLAPHLSSHHAMWTHLLHELHYAGKCSSTGVAIRSECSGATNKHFENVQV